MWQKLQIQKKLTTLPEFFDNKTVKKIKKKYGKADVVTAFNVFAHNDRLREILNNIEELNRLATVENLYLRFNIY